MSEIPYYFETPVPKYFRENGWFDNEHMFKFVTWAFSKCQTKAHKIVLENREITLAPYEFVAGRLKSPAECFLSENIFRNQQKALISAGLLKKTTNSLTNHYTCYVWVTERFCKINNQQNNQPSTNHQPTINHKSEDKKIRNKKDHHPYPSLPEVQKGDDDGKMMDDDFSLKNEEKKIEMVFMVNGTEKTVSLAQSDYDACLAIKGTHNAVEYAIGYILRSPGRKSKIYNWPNALQKWTIGNDIKPRLQENEEMARRLEKEFDQGNGWRCQTHTDMKKDQKGILFYNAMGYQEPIFIPYIDQEFKEKVTKILRDKQMQKGLISKS